MTNRTMESNTSHGHVFVVNAHRRNILVIQPPFVNMFKQIPADNLVMKILLSDAKHKRNDIRKRSEDQAELKLRRQQSKRIESA